MIDALSEIKRWGNGLGVRLPDAVTKAAGLHVRQWVCIDVEGGRIVITPRSDMPFSLEQRIARFDPVRHGGEAMATGALRTERR